MTPHLYKRMRTEIDELRAEKAEILTALDNLLTHCGCAPQTPCADCQHARATIAKNRGAR